jgi:hypothetical protein
LPQKQSQRLPVAQQIRNGLAQARVGLRFAPGELPLQPLMELLHHRAAVLLMKLEPFLGAARIRETSPAANNNCTS